MDRSAYVRFQTVDGRSLSRRFVPVCATSRHLDAGTAVSSKLPFDPDHSVGADHHGRTDPHFAGKGRA
jgi:hypothetical protein